jgi:hypothetical protein
LGPVYEEQDPLGVRVADQPLTDVRRRECLAEPVAIWINARE